MRSVTLSVLSFLLIISLFANAFLILQRQTMLSLPTYGGKPDTKNAVVTQLKPQAFGQIVVRSEPRGQKLCADKSQALLGDCLLQQTKTALTSQSFIVMRPTRYAYSMPESLLPVLPASLPVYRDQGVISSIASVIDALPALKASLAQGRKELAPVGAQFVTADGAYSVSVNVIRREAEIRSNTKPVKYRLKLRRAELLSSERVIDLASSFALSFGVDVSMYGTPRVFGETLSGSSVDTGAPAWVDRSQQPVVQVVWPMTFDGKRVIDADMNPVAALAVIISQQTQKAIGMTLKLHAPVELMHSDYPSAQKAAIKQGILSGGIRPVPSSLTGALKTVTFSSSTLAYLMKADPYTKDPTYFLPVIILSGTLPASCDSCSATAWETYIPATDPAAIRWDILPDAPASLSPSLSSSVKRK